MIDKKYILAAMEIPFVSNFVASNWITYSDPMTKEYTDLEILDTLVYRALRLFEVMVEIEKEVNPKDKNKE